MKQPKPPTRVRFIRRDGTVSPTIDLGFREAMLSLGPDRVVRIPARETRIILWDDCWGYWTSNREPQAIPEWRRPDTPEDGVPAVAT